jgi:hypothetical protein
MAVEESVTSGTTTRDDMHAIRLLISSPLAWDWPRCFIRGKTRRVTSAAGQGPGRKKTGIVDHSDDWKWVSRNATESGSKVAARILGNRAAYVDHHHALGMLMGRQDAPGGTVTTSALRAVRSHGRRLCIQLATMKDATPRKAEKPDPKPQWLEPDDEPDDGPDAPPVVTITGADPEFPPAAAVTW